MAQKIRADAQDVLRWMEHVNEEHLYGIVDEATLDKMRRVCAYLQDHANDASAP